MNIIEARQHVAGEIARIERQNTDKELRPWMRDACPAALEHWGLVQQRIALEGGNLNRACLANLNITPSGRSEAQKRASATAGNRLAKAKSA
jgi:hypothetical protein